MDLGGLIAHLARGGETEAALKLARALLAVLPGRPLTEEEAETEEPSPLPKPRARCGEHEYGRILKEDIPALVEAAGEEGLRVLCDLLTEAVRLSVRGGEEPAPQEFSYLWREAIEEDRYVPHGLKDVLTSAVRDAAQRLAEKEPQTVARLVGLLEERPWDIFRRLALHLLRRFPAAAPELVTARLTDRGLFDSLGDAYEYFHLQEECFGRLTKEQQAVVFGWIAEGADVDQYRRSMEEWTGRPSPEEEVEGYRRKWQLGKLLPLEGYLEGEWRSRFESLLEESGRPEHPDRAFTVRTGVMGSDSPKSAQELSATPVDEVVSLLQEWRPSGEWGAPTPRGLAIEVGRMVAGNPAKWAAEAGRFKEVDAAYVWGFVSGLRDACKAKQSFEWPPALDLCQWALRQPREIRAREDRPTGDEGFDEDWGSGRLEIARLMSAGFEEGASQVPFRLWNKAWAVVEPLTHDPDPTPEFEAHYTSPELSAFSIAINTVRGCAMEAVMRYALWRLRDLESEPAKRAAVRALQELPEVVTVLEKHLDPSVDQSLAIRSVYGQWLPWLVLLDREWVKENLGRILPAEPELEAYRDVAWDAYVTFCGAYAEVFELLRGEYSRAVERIRERQAERAGLGHPDQHLAEHLMVLYWRGKLELGDSIFGAFWEQADDELRGHAIAVEGQRLHETGEAVPEQIVSRLKDLWAQSLKAAKAAGAGQHREELQAFGWWFASGKFDDTWSMARLAETLQLAEWVEPDTEVVGRLAEVAEKMPQEAVQCLRMMVEGDKERWHIHGWKEAAKKLLATALASSDEPTMEAAMDVVDRLLRRGHFEFRDLLE